MTLRDALREGTERLGRHRVSSPRLNAEVLLTHCLGVDRTYLYTHDDRVLTEEESVRFEDVLYERISGVPVQYIVGRQEFYGRYFSVNPAVLIPRPETEFIVEAVLELGPAAGTSIVDIGTGSGCIGITLALELPETRVTIADISLDALLVARQNASALHAPVDIACMDLATAFAGPFDFIVSNPPYINPDDAPGLQREVREHEPSVALYAPDRGYGQLERLIPAAEQLLAPGGYLVLEIGFGMEARTLGLLGERWERMPTRTDLQGIPRTIVARLAMAATV